MNKDILIIILGWLITIILLFVFVPKNKLRQAHVSFLFMQVLTWVLGLLAVEMKLIVYPVRSFPLATHTCFDFEYFIYPAFSTLFNLHYPENKNHLQQLLYYFYYCSALTLIESIVETYTNIVEYISWSWYMSWFSFLITFYLSRKYYVWFFKIKKQN